MSALSGDALRRWDVASPVAGQPAGEVRVRDGALQLATRWAVVPPDGSASPFINSAELRVTGPADFAPKALVRLPEGNVTFGVSCRMRRAIFSNGTAGGARNSTMWGVRRAVAARDIVIPHGTRRLRFGNRDLRFAFIVVAPNRAAVQDSQLRAIDEGRRYFEAAFAQKTRGRWRASSPLLRPVDSLAAFDRGDGDWLAWRSFDGGRWHGEERFDDRHPYPTRLAGGPFDSPRRPAVVSRWNGHRFAVFFRGEGDRLHWKAHDDRWHHHALVEGGGPMTSDPAVAAPGGDELGVFYRGGDDPLVWRAFAGGRWHPEESFGAAHPYPTQMRSAPAVVAGWADHRYAVFFRGEDDRLHWKAHHAGRWHRHALIPGGGKLTSEPAVMAFSLGLLAVFYRTEGDWLAWRLFDGERWLAEDVFNDGSLPTRMSSAPIVVTGWRGTRYAVFFRGQDGRLRWKAHHGGRWHSDALVEGSGPVSSGPAVVLLAP